MIRELTDHLARLTDRYPFNSPWVRTFVKEHWLAAWFIALSGVGLVQSFGDIHLFFDARLYLRATESWLAGGDPWAVNIQGFYFAAPPPTLIPFAPVALLPEDVGVVAVAAICFGGAVATVRLLRLPWWWLLFPPMTQALLSANVQTLLVPLLVVGQGPLATFLKVYAAVPMVILGRRRELAVVVAALAISAPLLPWSGFINAFPTITANLADQTHYALPTPILVLAAPLALVALAVVGRATAAWMAVPALWPSQQYYYGTLTIGARSNLAAAIIAFPVPGSGLIALLVLAAVTWRRQGEPRWLGSARERGGVLGRSAR